MAEKTENTENKFDPEKVVKETASGTMELTEPIKDGDRTITELKFDFLGLSGIEFAEVMDEVDDGKTGNFRISKAQGLALFAATAAKENGLLKKELIERMSIQDSIKAIQRATVFFVASSRAGNNRITKE